MFQLKTMTTQHNVKHNHQQPTNSYLHFCALYITDTLEIPGCNLNLDILLEIIITSSLRKDLRGTIKNPCL